MFFCITLTSDYSFFVKTHQRKICFLVFSFKKSKLLFSFTRKLIFWKKKKILDIFPTVLALPKNYFFILVTFSVEHQQPRFRLLKKFRLHQFFLSESLIWSPLLLLGHLLGDEGGRSSSYSSSANVPRKNFYCEKLTNEYSFYCIKLTNDYYLLWLFFLA